MISSGPVNRMPPAARQPTTTPPGSSAPMRGEAVPVRSEVLFQGQRTVEISHNGEIYRLQATRLGKLILTK